MGCRLGRQSHTRFFRHNDLGHLESILAELRCGEAVEADGGAPSGSVFVAVESVYSMDGDVAPLADILDACEAFGASAIVDEAHG